MKLRKIILIVIAVSFVQCQSSSSNNQKQDGHAHSSGTHAESQREGHSGHTEAGPQFKRVRLSSEKMASVKIAYDTLRRMTLKTNVKANGQIVLSPDNRTRISTLVGGRVKQVNVIEGDYVEKGEVLALLEGHQITHLQKKYLTNREKLPYLKKEYQRQKQLLTEEVGSERAFQKAKSEYRSTKAEVNAMAQNLKMLGILDEVRKGEVASAVRIVAPFSGHIGTINISRGEFVNPKQFLIEVMNTDKAHIDLKVYEKALSKVQKRQTVLFTYANQPGPSLHGKVFRIGRQYRQESQSVKVHVKISRPDKVKLVPGTYVNAKIQAEASKNLALPEEAVIRDGNQTYVFAPASSIKKDQKEGSHKGHDHKPEAKEFIRIPVKAGTTEAGYTAIQFRKSVDRDTRFVSKGSYYLQAEMKKSVGGHHH